MPFTLDEDLQKAQAWIDGEFGPRGPYTQVYLDHDVAVLLAERAIAEGISIAEAARQAIERGLSV